MLQILVVKPIQTTNHQGGLPLIQKPTGSSGMQLKVQLFSAHRIMFWRRDTSYVESFNNVMNIFQDKRIAFSNTQCSIRSQLAVWNRQDQRAPRRQKGKKNYEDPTYCYRDSVSDSYIKSICNYRRRNRKNQNP